MADHITLYADHLFMKAGFSDGWLVGELLIERLDYTGRFDAKAVLIALVERRLLPALPSAVEVEHWTSHNPVRVKNWPDAAFPAALRNFAVQVSIADVLAIVQELEPPPGKGSGGPKTPPTPASEPSDPPAGSGIIVDLFAGGGGASTAIFQATGRHPDIAVNHNPVALDIHEANHPTTRHFRCTVHEVDPVEATGGRPVDLLWASPDCTHFSKARGGKPVEKRIRSLADVVVVWAEKVRPRVIALENVEEFKDWGPVLEDGKPCPDRKGIDFRRWVKALRDLGYAVDWRELVAADYGAPTTRKRLFLIARCDGLPIRWPAQTHASRARIAKGEAPGLLPWRAAAEIIDWSIEVPSIFDRKRPLKPKTLARIGKGLKRYVIDSPAPFIVPVTHSKGWNTARDGQEPIPTMTTAKGGEFAVTAPTILPLTHGGGEDRVYSLEDAAHAVTAANRGETALGSAFLVPHYGEALGQDPRARDIQASYPAVTPNGNGGDLAAIHMSQFNGRSVGGEAGRPLPTALDRDHSAAVAAYLGRQFGSTVSGRPMQEPHPAVMAQGDRGGSKSQAVAASMIRQQGQSIGSDAEAPTGAVMPSGAGKTGVVAAHMSSIAYGDDWRRAGLRAWPMEATPGAVTAAGDKTLVASSMIQHNGRSVGRPADEPLTALTDRSTQQQLLAASIDKYYATGVAQSAGEALGTATGKARFSLNAAFLEQANTGVVGHAATAPVSTIVEWGSTQRLIEVGMIPADDHAGASRRARVVAFLWEQFGEPTEAEWSAPLATAAGRLKFGLVILDGWVWQIVDIGMRMLVPRELFNAQGFPPTYVIDVTLDGRPVTKTAQTSMAGNSVSPPPAEATLRANLPEEWLWKEVA